MINQEIKNELIKYLYDNIYTNAQLLIMNLSALNRDFHYIHEIDKDEFDIPCRELKRVVETFKERFKKNLKSIKTFLKKDNTNSTDRIQYDYEELFPFKFNYYQNYTGKIRYSLIYDMKYPAEKIIEEFSKEFLKDREGIKINIDHFIRKIKICVCSYYAYSNGRSIAEPEKDVEQLIKVCDEIDEFNKEIYNKFVPEDEDKKTYEEL